MCADLLNTSEHVLHLDTPSLGRTQRMNTSGRPILSWRRSTLDCTDSMDQLMNSVVQCTGSTESSRIRVSVNVVTLHYSSNPIVGCSLCRTSRSHWNWKRGLTSPACPAVYDYHLSRNSSGMLHTVCINKEWPSWICNYDTSVSKKGSIPSMSCPEDLHFLLLSVKSVCSCDHRWQSPKLRF